MLRSSPLVSSQAPIAIGKFVGHAEYLRAPSTGPAASFDSWLADGFDLAHERYGSAWTGIFQMGVAHGFLWRDATSDACFCGVVAPSVDAVGRQYPLAIGVTVSAAIYGAQPHLLPVALRDFADAAFATIAEARANALSRDELTSRLAALPVPDVEAVIRAERDYSAWCSGMQAEQAWAALLPGADPMSTAWARVERAAALLAKPGDVRALRFPLAASPAAASALWLDVLRRAAGIALPRAAFWAAYEGPLLVPPAEPHPSLVGEMWLGSDPGDGIFDAAAEVGDAPALSHRDTPPSSLMSEFLEQITDRR